VKKEGREGRRLKLKRRHGTALAHGAVWALVEPFRNNILPPLTTPHPRHLLQPDQDLASSILLPILINRVSRTCLGCSVEPSEPNSATLLQCLHLCRLLISACTQAKSSRVQKHADVSPCSIQPRCLATPSQSALVWTDGMSAMCGYGGPHRHPAIGADAIIHASKDLWSRLLAKDRLNGINYSKGRPASRLAHDYCMYAGVRRLHTRVSYIVGHFSFH
jgi:hypothetical protein